MIHLVVSFGCFKMFGFSFGTFQHKLLRHISACEHLEDNNLVLSLYKIVRSLTAVHPDDHEENVFS